MVCERRGGIGFHDSYFVQDVLPRLQRSGQLPSQMGEVLGFGNEAIVFSLGTDRVIRIQPTYELWPEQADDVYERIKAAPSGGLYAERFDVRKIDGIDEDGDRVTFAVYAILERLFPLTDVERRIIDAAVRASSMSALSQEEVPKKLALFLQAYLTLDIDLDSANVMKRGDEYVIIDPE